MEKAEYENKDGLSYRKYSNYDEYKKHQSSKYDEIMNKKGGFTKLMILSYRMKFYRRFKHISKYLSSKGQRILCLGARQGTEVEVLRDIGFYNSTGIDLNPGVNNPYVFKGDFMSVDEPDGSIDLIYTNSIDHAYDVPKFLDECIRILQPKGYAIFDIAIQEGGNYEAIKYDEDVLFKIIVNKFRRTIKVETENKWNWKWVIVQK